jgi:hypothetical protein
MPRLYRHMWVITSENGEEIEMKLQKEDADLFFKLMWELQFYVNQKRQILPDVDSLEDYVILSSGDKLPVRDALWENPDLIDAYVRDNPDGLPAEELDIIQKWKRFVAGTFQIFRFLKKHAIFIGEDSQVYGVLSLHDSLEEMFYGRPLPMMAKAVLLPFKGRIIYDGLLRGYNIYFGSGIRSSLKEEYMTAKQNDRIITTLEPETVGPTPPARKSKKARKDWGPLVDDLVRTTERIKGGPAIQSSALALLRASARLAQAAVHHPDDLDELWHLRQQAQKALTRLRTTLDRADR